MATLTGWFNRSRDEPVGTTIQLKAAIRTCRLPDLGKVYSLQHRCFRRTLAYRRSTLLSLWMWPRVRFLVAVKDGAVVGAVIGDKHQGVSRVVSICVDPDCRRTGIGSSLLMAIEQALPEGPMILMVEHTNASARALYLAHGYQQVSVQRNYYGPGSDGLWMRKDRDITPPA